MRYSQTTEVIANSYSFVPYRRVESLKIIYLQDCLSPRSLQALPAGAESLCIVEQPFESGAKSALQLNIGLSNGVLLRTTLDSVSGDLADTRTR